MITYTNHSSNTESSNNQIGRPRSGSPTDLFITSVITDRIGRHAVILTIIIKNYKFREKKKKSQVMKERENLHEKTDKGGVNCLMSF